MRGEMAGPPERLVRGLVDGPSVVAGFEWHDVVGSTNALAAQAARRSVPEVWVVAADVQTAGRGRLGRRWTAPPGTSLMCSLVLRPPVSSAWPLVPLLAGLALAEAVGPFAPAAAVAAKWPNDLLIGGRKAGGILAEVVGEAVVVGIGLNVDWRGVARPADLATATSLAEAAGAPVDRWRVFAALIGVFGNRYRAWRAAPTAFLGDYRARCATIGRPVSVERPGAPPLRGMAEDVTERGGLRVRDADGTAEEVLAGDVEHVR